MTFNELDKRTILWNEIANGHQPRFARKATQSALCFEEMVKEFIQNEFKIIHKFYSGEEFGENEAKKLFLDDYADSRFVFIEYKNLGVPFTLICDLFNAIHKVAKTTFSNNKLIEAYRRVIESNFSKFVKSDETHDVVWAQNEADEMSALLGVTEKITIELSHGYWVFRDQNGKIRKPSTFKPVDLSDLI